MWVKMYSGMLLFILSVLKKYSHVLTCLQGSCHSEHFHMYSFWKVWKNSEFFLCIYRNSLKLGRSLKYTICPFVLITLSNMILSFMSFPYTFLYLLGNVIWELSPLIEAHLWGTFKILHKTNETSCWINADKNCHC